ncbi:flagellar biosynthesis protein FlhF [Colwellia sp. RSH04]|uniref:flagellar biosynthesis protein FlhF n=1 Tax=Colwellia sp. RSH04 TaxID=2305464 RepID=UPI000E584C67|nr:flagellar biosynthesis protein FlhF [Colwellia sp. RSH04]RHW75996.1 flagellar biosynthesis protein FlhF [Colwellia sp. RSH04]
MKIKRFVAKDMRTALAQIKVELGADAVIMSNKKIPEGVELMAAVDYNQAPTEVKPHAEKVTQTEQMNEDVVHLSKQTQQESTTKPLTENSNQPKPPVDSLSALLGRQVQQGQPSIGNIDKVDMPEDDIEQQLKSFTERLKQSTPEGIIPAPSENLSIMHDAKEMIDDSDSITSVASINKEDYQLSQSEHDLTNVSASDFNKMQQEMASIRAILEHQVSGLMWQDMAQKNPQRAALLNKLLNLGLSEQIADQIAGYVPEQLGEQVAWEQAKQLIAKQVNTTQNDIIKRGGVVALVGPTGVGKTTTIAKLAAGFAQVHGHEQVALISTDTFRIAGFEQLATYGKIIGCQVKLAKDSQELDVLLQQFAKKKLILIDTAGMGQRDMRLAEQLSALVSNARVRIRNYLVLAANTQQGVMQENVDRFRKVPLSGCIYTKLDESLSIGEIITTAVQNGLPIGYLTDGQRVPEDIKVANAEKLVTLADKMATKSVRTNSVHMQSMPISRAAMV